ncbi:DHH family phosphoesterase [Candidatus Woesearchaeota archaeon]|nr:MAG: DHH family phosphoesterase [Candidatus Woesearchaeota archaeon]
MVKIGDYKEFKAALDLAAARFKKVNQNEVIRLVSNLDADGITAASIIVKALNRENRRYSISIVQQLNEKVIDELSNEDYNVFLFTDLGSGQLSNIKKRLGKKQIFILDHHKTRKVDVPDNICHVNPHLFGIDGSREISASGVAFMFAERLNEKNKDMADIAITGAIGDIQEAHGFSTLNNEILETAIKKKLITVEQDLRIYGIRNRPLYKALEYSKGIPHVSGSESGSIQFLQSLGISPKEKTKWRTIMDLSKEEKKRLIAGIIMKRKGCENPEEIIGPVYLRTKEDTYSQLKDVKEFSTILNAAGRLDQASIGIGACLGDSESKKSAIRVYNKYKRELVSYLRWFRDNQDSPNIIRKDSLVIINAQDNVRSTMIGTMLSILSKSGELGENTFLLGLAQQMDGYTKVSLRFSGEKDDVDLTEIVRGIVKITGGEAGGHKFAAGAIIETEKEDDFIRAAKRLILNKAIEEKV